MKLHSALIPIGYLSLVAQAVPLLTLGDEIGEILGHSKTNEENDLSSWRHGQSRQVEDAEWDAIIVGGGTAGIVVADRLSEAGKKTLLLELGGSSYGITGGRERPGWLNGTELSRVDVPGLCKLEVNTQTPF